MRHPRLHVYLDVVDFVRAVTERGSGYVPEASPTHAAHMVELLEKSYVAARTGQAQEIASML